MKRAPQWAQRSLVMDVLHSVEELETSPEERRWPPGLSSVVKEGFHEVVLY